MFIVEDYTCMNGALCWDCNIIVFLFTVQKCGPRESADRVQWEKLGSFTITFYAEISSCWQTSRHLKGYAWIDWQFHLAWTRLHIPSHSLLTLVTYPFQPTTLSSKSSEQEPSCPATPSINLRIDSSGKYPSSPASAMYLCHYLWLMCVYRKCVSKWFMKWTCDNCVKWYWPTLCWCTLHSVVCRQMFCFPGRENQCSLRLTIGTELQYTWLHEL
jgi:hypothetical protein